MHSSLRCPTTRRNRSSRKGFPPRVHLRILTSAGAVCLALLAACRAHPPPLDILPERETFIALARDFAGFREFGRIDLGERPAQSETHPGGRLVVYVNSVPKPGAKEFPVGTIIVKENLSAKTEPASTKKVFAMVKRGGGFNAEGATGWEWFELEEGDKGVAIRWRGVGAPDGEGYGGDPMGSCNSCHQMAVKNDYVLAAALQLK